MVKCMMPVDDKESELDRQMEKMRDAIEILGNIVSKDYDVIEQNEEINSITDLDIAKHIIKMMITNMN